MAGYTKLFNSILASTIWREDDKTRIVWITMLAMADKNGVAESSIPGLADMARVSIADCEAALEKLSSPDKYSRTKEFDGRRIEPVDGGWRLLNHGKYRSKMSADERREYNRIKQAEHRASKSVNSASADVSNVIDESALLAHSEAAPKADPLTAQTNNGFPKLEEVKTYGEMRGLKSSDCEQFWHHFESAGWIDKNGHQIHKWQSKLMTWKTQQQSGSGPVKFLPPQPTLMDKEALRQLEDAKRL